MDEAIDAGQVSMLAQWTQRQQSLGLPVVYAAAALDKCLHVPVLDWWLTSGLPFTYSTLALHHATARGRTRVLDWWLAASRSNRVPELKYTPLVMTLASVDVYGDGVFKSRVLQWWDQSGLDLQLPDHTQPSFPSPIDLCMDMRVLDWWLHRAQRRHAASHVTVSIQECFPHSTHVAMHRAAYWNKLDVLDWWRTTGARAGLEMRYVPHRIFELAAMVRWIDHQNFNKKACSLTWCLEHLRPITFRGTLYTSGHKVAKTRRWTIWPRKSSRASPRRCAQVQTTVDWKRLPVGI